MPAVPQKVTGFLRVDLDTDETRLPTDSARFAKGWTWNVNKNPIGQEGYNAGAGTPREGCIIQSASITMPLGDNYCIGTYEARDVNELYVFIYNSNFNHFIYRINGVDGSAQLVYANKLLNFQLDPQHFISEGRAVLKTVQYFNKSTSEIEIRKFLCWVEYNQPRMLSVEDAIATASFDMTAHPFFDPLVVGQNAIDQVIEDYINLAVSTPMDCITFTPQERLPSEETKQNLMLFKGWQWRLKYIDVYNRESEHGIISDRYFTVIGSNCLPASNGMPRCVRLKFNAGHPLVNKIQLEFRTCSGNSDLSVDSDWYLYDTIDKYDNSGSLQFWERDILNPYQVKLDEMNDANTANPGTYTPDQITEAINSLTRYNALDNTFDYTFCGDKQCQLIPVSETVRTDNNVPRTSSSIFGLNEGIGLANNKRGFEPLPLDDIKKVSVVAVPSQDECEEFELRKIVVYALIYRPNTTGSPGPLITGFVHYLDPPDNDYEVILNTCGGIEKFKFKTMWSTVPPSLDNTVPLSGQVFPIGQDNFTAYLAGTPYYAIGQQVMLNRYTLEECPCGVFFADRTPENIECIKDDPWDWWAFQKFEFNVPAGEYIVRLSHHRSKLSQDYQITSTYVTGLRQFGDYVASTAFDRPSSRRKEIVVDVSTTDHLGKWAIDNFFMIMSTVLVVGDTSEGNSYEMYVKEDVINRIPIALAQAVPESGMGISGSADKWTTVYTDHNGFFFRGGGDPLVPPTNTNNNDYIAVDNCDPEFPEFPWYLPQWPSGTVIWGAIGCIHASGIPVGEYFLFAGENEFPDSNRRFIKGRIKLCDTDIGVGGVSIVPFNMRPTRTDADGYFEIIAHGRSLAPVDSVNDTLLITQSACQLSRCDDPCNSTFERIIVTHINCQEAPRETTIPDVLIRMNGINKSGPQNGGRYQAGFVMHGDGRHSYVQTAEHLFVDVKSMLETHRFAHSTLEFTISANLILPDWVEYITFVLSQNLNWSDFFMWSADRVDFVDDGGYITTTNPTKIRIYYESMLEYVKQSNLKSNAIWSFIETGEENNQNVTGDVIEFYRQADGTWFDKSIVSSVRYDKDGRYIEIDYSDGYKDLKAGALFKVMRPKTCQTGDIFMELCPSIRVIAGIPQVLTGQLSYMDSYFLTRTFPVPLYTIDTTDPTKITKTVNVRNSTYLYEHHSPSDSWGNHCGTRGRIFFKNPYEREQYRTMEIALSKPLINKSNFNGLSYFQLEDIDRFDEQQWGSITVVLPQINTLLVICKRDNFVVGFSDTGVRVDANYQVYAGSAEGRFGTPQRKIGQNYGCQVGDINTIRQRSGVVVFLDRARGDLVFHMYSQSGDVSVNGFHAWLSQKISIQNNNNNNPQRTHNAYFVGGVDPKTNEYFLTSFVMANLDNNLTHGPDYFQLPDDAFLNQDMDVSLAANETIVVDIPTASMKGFAHFTPEYYGSLESFHADRNMLIFRRANAWSTHPGNGLVPYLNYFGVQTKKVLVFIVNISPEKVKRFMYIEVYNSNHKLIASEVTTEQGQVSRIPASYFQRVDNFWCAAFLCATNTPSDINIPIETGINSLIDGNPLSGRWMSVRLVSEDADDAEYCELNSICTYVIPSGKSAD